MSAPTKITFEVKTLSTAVKDVIAAVQRRNTLAILHNLMIEVDADCTARVSASDLDIWASRKLTAAATDGAIKFTVPAHRLAEVLATFDSSAQVRLEIEGSAMVAVCGRARIRFTTLPAADFPVMVQPEGAVEFTIDATQLAKALTGVRHCISTEETRYYLNGVYLHVAGGKLRMATTDGHRLARYIGDIPAGAEAMPGVILRTAYINMILAAAGDGDGPIEFAVSKGKVAMVAGDLRIVAKTIDGTFPDYERVIPSDVKRTVVFDRDSLMHAANRVATATSDKVRAAKLEIGPHGAVLTVTSPEHGPSIEEVACDLTGEAIEVGFNLRYLRDALQALPVDTVEIGFTDSAGPARITSLPPGALDGVLMPMRV